MARVLWAFAVLWAATASSSARQLVLSRGRRLRESAQSISPHGLVTDYHVDGIMHHHVAYLDNHPMVLGVQCPAGRLSHIGLTLRPEAVVTLGHLGVSEQFLHGTDVWGCEYHMHNDGDDETRHFDSQNHIGERGAPFYLSVSAVRRACALPAATTDGTGVAEACVDAMEDQSLADVTSAAATALGSAPASFRVELQVDAVGYQHLFESLEIHVERRLATSLRDHVHNHIRSGAADDPNGVTPAGRRSLYTWSTPTVYREYSVVNFNWDARNRQPKKQWINLLGGLMYCQNCYAYIGADVLVKSKWYWATLQTATFRVSGSALLNIDVYIHDVQRSMSRSTSGNVLVPANRGKDAYQKMTRVNIPTTYLTIWFDLNFQFSYSAAFNARAKLSGEGPAFKSNNVVTIGSTYSKRRGWTRINERSLTSSTRKPWLQLYGSLTVSATAHLKVQVNMFGVWPVTLDIQPFGYAKLTLGYDSRCSRSVEARIQVGANAKLDLEVGDIDYRIFGYKVDLPNLPYSFRTTDLMPFRWVRGRGLSGCTHARGGSSSRRRRLGAPPRARARLLGDASADLDFRHADDAPHDDAAAMSAFLALSHRAAMAKGVERSRARMLCLVRGGSADECGSSDNPNVPAPVPPARLLADDFSGSSWATGPWSWCSADCGRGSRERVVECTHPEHGVVDDGYCGEPRPPAIDPCSAACRGMSDSLALGPVLRLPSTPFDLGVRPSGADVSLHLLDMTLDEDDNGWSVVLEPDAVTGSNPNAQGDLYVAAFRDSTCPVVLPDSNAPRPMWDDTPGGTEALFLSPSDVGTRHGDRLVLSVAFRGSSSDTLRIRSRPFKELQSAFPVLVSLPALAVASSGALSDWSSNVEDAVRSGINCEAQGTYWNGEPGYSAYGVYRTSACDGTPPALPLHGLATCASPAVEGALSLPTVRGAIELSWPAVNLGTPGQSANFSSPWPQRSSDKPAVRHFTFTPQAGAVGVVVDATLLTLDDTPLSLEVGQISARGAWPGEDDVITSPSLASVGLDSVATVAITGTDFVERAPLAISAAIPASGGQSRLEVQASEIWPLETGFARTGSTPVGGTSYFVLDVPSTATFVRIELQTLEGDADLFVRTNTPFASRVSWDAITRNFRHLQALGLPNDQIMERLYEGMPSSLRSFSTDPIDVVETTPSSGTFAPRYFIAVTAYVKSSFRLVVQAVEQLDPGVAVVRQARPLQYSFFTGMPASRDPADESSLFYDHRLRVAETQVAGVSMHAGSEERFFPSVLEGFSGLALAAVAPEQRAEVVAEYLPSTDIARRMIMGIRGQFHDSTSAPSPPRVFPISDLPENYEEVVASDVAPARRLAAQVEDTDAAAIGEATATYPADPAVADALHQWYTALAGRNASWVQGVAAAPVSPADGARGLRGPRGPAALCAAKAAAVGVQGDDAASLIIQQCEAGPIPAGDSRMSPRPILQSGVSYGDGQPATGPVPEEARRLHTAKPRSLASGSLAPLPRRAEATPDTPTTAQRVERSLASAAGGGRALTVAAAVDGVVLPADASSAVMQDPAASILGLAARVAPSPSGPRRLAGSSTSEETAPAVVTLSEFQSGIWERLADCSASVGTLTATECVRVTGAGDATTFIRVDVPARLTVYASVVAAADKEPRDAAYLIRSKAGQLPTPGDSDDEALSTGRTMVFLNCEFAARPAFVSVTANNAGSITFGVIVAAVDAREQCPEYGWVPGPWGEWSHSCGQATRTRPLVCRATLSNEPVDDSFCNPAPEAMPAQEEATDLGECVWAVSHWSMCTKPCGGGEQFRTMDCLNGGGRGEKVLDAHCSGNPITARGCNLGSCQTAFWYAHGWRACSARCGGGRRTRDVECRVSSSSTPTVSSIASSPSQCAGQMPAATEACGMEPCDEVSFETVQFDFRHLRNGNRWTEPVVPAGAVSYYMWERDASTRGVCVEVEPHAPLAEDAGICSVSQQREAAQCLASAVACTEANRTAASKLECYADSFECLVGVGCGAATNGNAVFDAANAVYRECLRASSDAGVSGDSAACDAMTDGLTSRINEDAPTPEVDLFLSPLSSEMEGALKAAATARTFSPVHEAARTEADIRAGRGFSPPTSERTALWSGASAFRSGEQSLWVWQDADEAFASSDRFLLGVRSRFGERRIDVSVSGLAAYPAVFGGDLVPGATVDAARIRDGGLTLEVTLTCDAFVPPLELLAAQRNLSAAVDDAASSVLDASLRGNAAGATLNSSIFRPDVIVAGITADESSATGWNRVAKPALLARTGGTPMARISFAGRRLTLVLPPVPGYRPSGDETLRLTVPGSLLRGGRPMEVPASVWSVTSTAADADCKVSKWGPWSYCSGICSVGTQTRTRKVERTASGVGAACPDTTQTRECNTCDPCLTVSCYNGGICSAGSCTCRPGYTGTDCSGPPVSSETFFWLADRWGQCSAACGGGLQSRSPRCMRVRASDGVSEVSAEQCNEADRPLLERECNDHDCDQAAATVAMTLDQDADTATGSFAQQEAFLDGVRDEVAAAVGLSADRLRMDGTAVVDAPNGTSTSPGGANSTGRALFSRRSFRHRRVVRAFFAMAPPQRIRVRSARSLQAAELPVDRALEVIQTQLATPGSPLLTQGSLARSVTDVEFEVRRGATNELVSSGGAAAVEAGDEASDSGGSAGAEGGAGDSGSSADGSAGGTASGGSSSGGETSGEPSGTGAPQTPAQGSPGANGTGVNSGAPSPGAQPQAPAPAGTTTEGGPLTIALAGVAGALFVGAAVAVGMLIHARRSPSKVAGKVRRDTSPPQVINPAMLSRSAVPHGKGPHSNPLASKGRR